MKHKKLNRTKGIYGEKLACKYLERNNYSRDEITEGIKSICEEYGVSSMVEFLF